MGEDAQCVRHEVCDVCAEGNVDRVTRVLDAAFAECVELLYPYTEKEIEAEGTSHDDLLSAPEVYEVVLSLPEGFSVTTVELLVKLVHEYMVTRAMADWMSIVCPGREGTWEKKYMSLREKIRTSLLSRRGKVRRRLRPF